MYNISLELVRGVELRDAALLVKRVIQACHTNSNEVYQGTSSRTELFGGGKLAV
jgi:hypothetical protein